MKSWTRAGHADSDLPTRYFVRNWGIEPIPEPTLDVEYGIYKRSRKKWLREHPNEHVLIKHERVVGFYPNRLDALKEGVMRFGDVPFFIAELSPDDDVENAVLDVG